MDSNLTTAIVSASGTTIVAIVALLVNNKRFDDMSQRIGRVETHMDRIETKLDHIEQLLVSYALDVARIKEKLGI
jgi:hypothetical protein